MSATAQQPRSKSASGSRSKPVSKPSQRRPKASSRSATESGRRGAASPSGPLVRAYPGARLGPLPVAPLIAWQVGVGAVLLAIGAESMLVIPAAALLIAIAVLTLVRWSGRPLWRWMRVWRARTARNRKAGPALPHDPPLVPLREWLPGLELASVEGKRGGAEVGVIHDGTGYVVVLGPDREDLITSADPVTIPLAALAEVGEAEGIALASAQLIVQTVPAPVPSLGAYGGQLAASYTEVNTASAPATASWWIALRLDPTRDGTGFTLDGEGNDAIRRALRSTVTWATKVLSSSGLPCRPLAKGEVREVLALTTGVDLHHRPTSLQARRTAERTRSWACDGGVHICGLVRGWPRVGLPGLSRLLALSGSLPVYSSVASLTVSWPPDRALRWSSYVRVTAGDIKSARAAYRQLAKQAARAKVHLTRLDGEQLPGVLATIPLGMGG